MNVGSLALESIGKLWHGNSKNADFARGQLGLIGRIEDDMAQSNMCPAWFHVASLGEYAVVRPLIDRANDAGIPVVLTFFSPTGINHFSERIPSGVNHLWYLPLDTPSNARRFIQAVKPRMAIFAVSEYWLNYLTELKHNEIPTFLVSAKITGNEPFFRWKDFRNVISAYTRIFAIDDESVSRLNSLEYTCAEKCANPLFDNAHKKASEDFSDSIIEAYVASNSNVLIAGSIHTDRDLDLIASLVANHPENRFIIVPHEVDSDTITTISKRIGSSVCLYSKSTPETDFDNSVLIIDRIGMLAHLYRYGSMAYIGGGFTSYLHSLLEAVAYGLPVSFGPRTERKVTPQQLIEIGVGTKVEKESDIDHWYTTLYNDSTKLTDIQRIANEYMQSSNGATDHIAHIIGLTRKTKNES